MNAWNHCLAASLLALLFTESSVPLAHACATFGPVREPKRTPSLALERVLIIHDPTTRIEHFVREVVFAGNARPFGFVVPTPSQPEVFPVTNAPFDALDYAFPFDPPPKSLGSASRARSTALADDWSPVRVIEKKAVGSFTAFILRATDATALAGWLRDNQLGSTAENDAWLASYVARDFYYVAMRYEPSKQRSSGKLQSETIRITFQSPLAYYPYREPMPAKGMRAAPRAIAMWVVTPVPLVPVAFEELRGTNRWVKPFQAGARREAVQGNVVRNQLSAAEARLIEPARNFVVQTFEDQKKLRDGLGDVVFVPERGVAEATRADANALVARVRGVQTADIEPLLSGGDTLKPLPLYVTDNGVRFDPGLRTKLLPKRPPRLPTTLGDEF